MEYIKKLLKESDENTNSKFIEFFGEDRISILPHYWQPNFKKNDEYIDPSARILNVY